MVEKAMKILFLIGFLVLSTNAFSNSLRSELQNQKETIAKLFQLIEDQNEKINDLKKSSCVIRSGRTNVSCLSGEVLTGAASYCEGVHALTNGITIDGNTVRSNRTDGACWGGNWQNGLMRIQAICC